jgi:choline dehydrogenase-like flavoprotein
VNVVSAFFKEEVRPWEGGILTTVCSSFENLDGHGHGVKLEATCMMPSLCLSMINWNSGTSWKTTAAKYPHMNSYISLTRDRDPGRVLHGPKIEYTPSAFDRRHILTGLIEMSRMLLVAGAREIHINVPGIRPFIVDETGGDATCEIVDPRFVEWIAHVEAVGNSPPNATFACAHQMGSNRMSAKKADGVVDQEGRVWGTKGLYITDASVFPSASGVNPMVTNLAISDITSRGIAAGLKKETGTKL